MLEERFELFKGDKSSPNYMFCAVAPGFVRASFRKLIAWFAACIGKLTVILAVLYPFTLLAIVLALAFVGEGWWVTTLLLYVPRALFGVPLPLLVVALLLYRRTRLLWTQLVATLLLLFPLMGMSLPWFTGASSAPAFRVMSFNADSGYAGASEIARAIEAVSPDVVLLQEAERMRGPFENELERLYPHVRSSTEFLIGSRFPIVERTPPGKLPYWGRERSPRFMRYVVRTPSGDVVIYSMHPASPRGVLQLYRFRGVFGRLRRGELFAGNPSKDVGENTGLRRLQVEAIGRMAAEETLPVIIAGDTNLPVLSPLFRANLGRYQDGFSVASGGFGYTYPQKYPWMRIDRILASEQLRFTSFQNGCRHLSDHFCVYAELQRR